jgi:hypothetical protein
MYVYDVVLLHDAVLLHLEHEVVSCYPDVAGLSSLPEAAVCVSAL